MLCSANNVHLYEETVIPLVPILVLAGLGVIILVTAAVLIARHRKKRR